MSSAGGFVVRIGTLALDVWNVALGSYPQLWLEQEPMNAREHRHVAVVFSILALFAALALLAHSMLIAG